MPGAYDLAALDRGQLERLRGSPQVGDVLREKIDALLTGGGTPSITKHQRSADPRDRMNATEARMADVLDLRIRSGEVKKWDFEDLTFRVGADRCRYTPDFVAQLLAGGVEVIEVKGEYIRDDARVKFLAAVRQWPWLHWRMLQWVDGGWRTVFDFTPVAAGKGAIGCLGS